MNKQSFSTNKQSFSANKQSFSSNKIVKFLGVWVVNSLLLLLISHVLQNGIVLGNDKITAAMSSVLCGLFLTLTPFMAHIILENYKYKISDRRIESAFLIMVNFVVIWIIKRFALTFGLGISNILLVGFLAVIVSLVYIVFDKYVNQLLNKK